MEEGAMVVIGGTPSMLKLQRNVGRLKWHSLEMRNNEPVKTGWMNLTDILSAKSSGGSKVNVVLKEGRETWDFTSPDDARIWVEGLPIATEILGLQGSRGAKEMKEWQSDRRVVREEELAAKKERDQQRKQELMSGGLGMKFTAQAMMD